MGTQKQTVMIFCISYQKGLYFQKINKNLVMKRTIKIASIITAYKYNINENC